MNLKEKILAGTAVGALAIAAVAFGSRQQQITPDLQADLNGDGIEDIVKIAYGTTTDSREIMVWDGKNVLTDHEGNLYAAPVKREPVSFYVEQPRQLTVTPVDVNGDGITDINLGYTFPLETGLPPMSSDFYITHTEAGYRLTQKDTGRQKEF